MGLSTNTTTYAGGAQTFAVNFALGFLSRADVQVRVNAAVDGAGAPVYTAFSWIDDSAISVIPTLTIGDTVEVLRTVSKTSLAANFAANTDVTPANLDISAKQGLMVYQELIDGRVEGTESPIVAGNRAEAAALVAEAAAAAALVSEGLADADKAAAAVSAAAALASENSAAASIVLTNADVAATGGAQAATAADAAATAADRVQTNTDKLAVAADRSAVAAALALTNADAVSSATSAAAAAASYDSFDDRYLGAKASAPVLDNDGAALLTGALYWNSISSALFIYTGAAWSAAAFDTSGAMIASNNLSDLNNAGAARTNLGLGTAATTDSTAYATAAQGSLADSSLQSGDANTYMQFHATDQWRVVVGGSERLEVKNSSPHVLVSGDLNSTSDERLKENIEPIENALTNVCKLEGVSFNWKDTGTKATGFIAQQVEPIMPDLVNTNEDDGIKSVNYIGLIGHLVEAIKEQQAQIDELKEVIKQR